jgi:hypothetical protein
MQAQITFLSSDIAMPKAARHGERRAIRQRKHLSQRASAKATLCPTNQVSRQ